MLEACTQHWGNLRRDCLFILVVLIFKKRYLVRTCNLLFLTLDMDLGFFVGFKEMLWCVGDSVGCHVYTGVRRNTCLV
jgi:hypothetical protein